MIVCPPSGKHSLVQPHATHFDADLARLVEAFRDNNPAAFYTLLMNSPLIYTITQTDNLWGRVGEEGEVQSIVYLHFLKSWERIRSLTLSSGSPVAGYLVEVIRNAVRDALHKRAAAEDGALAAARLGRPRQ